MTERGALRRHIKVLERRRDYLTQRIDGKDYPESVTNYDRGERAALQAAVELMTQELASLPYIALLPGELSASEESNERADGN